MAGHGRLLAVLVILALIAVSVVAWLDRLGEGLCGNTAIFRKASPDGALVAVVFERDCGATTAPSTQVSLFGAGSTLSNKAGNIFIFDGGSGDWGTGPHGPRVEIEWLGARALHISHDAAARVFKAERRVRAVRLSYESR